MTSSVVVSITFKCEQASYLSQVIKWRRGHAGVVFRS